MDTTAQAFTPPSVEEKIVGWGQFLQDRTIDPTIDAFVQTVADRIAAFCSSDPAAKITYHVHRHMPPHALALCYAIGDAHYLWVSVFPDTDEHRNHRSTVCRASRSLQGKAYGSIVCATPDEVASAIITEITCVCRGGD